MKKERLPLKGMVYASMFGAMTAVGALISIPLQPVPITLQTFFLYLAAALIGGDLGALSQIVYVLLGVFGLPVFSGGKAGLGVLMGPTGGYLAGFIVAAFVVGKLAETRKNASFSWLVLSMLAGGIIVYTLGVLQLMLVADLSPAKAVAAGVLPFAPGEVLKIVAAAAIVTKIRGRINI
jgi:biotin transport system substrate-specific component